MKQYDVIVVGAGLAGLQCARLLGKQGVRVLLLDRKPALQQSIHTTGIFVRRTLEDFDFPEDCLGPVVRHVRLYSPARRPMDLVSPHAEFRVGRMARLYERFRRTACDPMWEWMPATSYAEHSPVRNELVVRLNSKDSSRWVKTRYLVGADGASSRVGKTLGLATNKEWLVGVEEVFQDVPLAGPPRLHCFLDPRLAPGYLAWLVHDGEELHIGLAGYPALFDPLPALQSFRSSLSGIVDLQPARLVERRGGRIPVGGILPHIANQQGLVIGDAAGAVSPLTAGGLDPCMRLSSFAAGVITDYLSSGDATVLAAYSGQRFRARFISRLWMRRFASKVQQPLLLEATCAALRLPLLNSLAWHVFFGRGSFPDLNRRLAVETVLEIT
jgi:flavin-dependent dehydrogenase